jgi:hypothetical protein
VALAAVLAVVFVALLLARGAGRPGLDGSDGLVALVVAVGLVRAWPPSTPWPVFLDASWYANTAAQIAVTGGLAFPVPALELPPAARASVVSTFRDQRAAGLPFPDDSRQGFHAVAFAVPNLDQPVAGPYHPPFYASWLAAWLGPGAPGGRLGWAAMAWTLGWLLAVAALARAAFGPAAAPVAAGLVAFGPAVAYYGRQPYAEPAAGALALTATWCLVRLARHQPGRPAAGWALAAGLGYGLALLAKVDALLPMAAGCLWWLAARRSGGGRREGLALAAGLALGLAHFAWLAATVSRLYVTLNGGGVLRLVLARGPWLILLAVLSLAGLALAGWLRRSGRAPGARAVRVALAVGVAVAVAAGTTLGWLVPEGSPPGTVAVLAWLVTPLGLWAGVVGLTWALEAAAPPAGPVLAQALVAAGLVLAAPVVNQSLSSVYTARRLVPMALPITAVLAGAAVAAWWQWRQMATGAERSRRRWVDAAVLAGLALASAGLLTAGADSVGPLREFAGGEGLARRVARHVGPDDVLLFPATLQGADPGRMAAAIWSLTGRHTAVVGAPDRDPAAVAQAVAAWRAAGRQVYYVTDTAHPPPELPGYGLDFLVEESAVTYALAPLPGLPPGTSPIDLQLQVFTVTPAAESR